MKKLIIILTFLISGICYGQPSLSSFTNTTQQSQIRAYVAYYDGLRQADIKKLTDSIAVHGRAIYRSAIDSATFAAIKVLPATIAALMATDAALNKQFTGLNTAVWSNMNGFKVRLDSSIVADAITIKSLTDLVRQLQATTVDLKPVYEEIRKTNESLNRSIEVQAAIKLWMDKVKTINFL